MGSLPAVISSEVWVWILSVTTASNVLSRIRLDKARTKLWSKAPAMEEFMLATGWAKENDHIRFSDKKWASTAIFQIWVLKFRARWTRSFSPESGLTKKFFSSRNLRATIDFLAQERMHLRPSDRDWVSATKVENITPANTSDAREVRWVLMKFSRNLSRALVRWTVKHPTSTVST